MEGVREGGDGRGGGGGEGWRKWKGREGETRRRSNDEPCDLTNSGVARMVGAQANSKSKCSEVASAAPKSVNY